MMEKIHFHMCLHNALVKSTAKNKTRLFLSPFLISTSWFLILAEAFGNDHVTAFSTTLRSATEKNEMGGYVTVPCPAKMTQRSSTADWIKFDGTHTEPIFHFKVTLCSYSCNKYCKLIDTVNLGLNYCTSYFKKVDLYNE